MTKRTTPRGRPKRAPAKVKPGDLRVTPRCAKTLRKYAKEHGLSDREAIADVLEGWRKRYEWEVAEVRKVVRKRHRLSLQRRRPEGEP
jgi:hypothetical protein